GCKRDNLYGGVPAVQIVRSIAFGDAKRLRATNGLLERQSLFHFRQNNVGSRIQYTGKCAELDGGQSGRKKRKNWNTIHHGGFTEKTLPPFTSQGHQFVIRVNDRPFIRGDCVRSMVQGGFQVIGCGLAALRVKRTGFEEHIGTRAIKPFVYVRKNFEMRSLRPMTVQKCDRIQSFRIGNPAGATRGDTCEPPPDIVAAAQLRFLCDEETKQRAPDIAETDDSKVVERNGGLFFAGAIRLPQRRAFAPRKGCAQLRSRERAQ